MADRIGHRGGAVAVHDECHLHPARRTGHILVAADLHTDPTWLNLVRTGLAMDAARRNGVHSELVAAINAAMSVSEYKYGLARSDRCGSTSGAGTS
jgi:hypothetical protein